MNKPSPKIDDYASYGRSVIRFALCVLLVVLLLSLILAFGGSGHALARFHALQVLAPVGIVLIVAIAQQRRRRFGPDAQGAIWKAMFEDEFRQLNLRRATRASLVGVLVLQIPLGMLLDALLPEVGMVFMGYVTMLVGAIAFMAAFLYYDRNAA